MIFSIYLLGGFVFGVYLYLRGALWDESIIGGLTWPVWIIVFAVIFSRKINA